MKATIDDAAALPKMFSDMVEGWFTHTYDGDDLFDEIEHDADVDAALTGVRDAYRRALAAGIGKQAGPLFERYFREFLASADVGISARDGGLYVAFTDESADGVALLDLPLGGMVDEAAEFSDDSTLMLLADALEDMARSLRERVGTLP